MSNLMSKYARQAGATAWPWQERNKVIELVEKFVLAPVSPDGAEFRRDPRRFWKSEALVVCSIAQARLDLHATSIAAVHWIW